MLSDPALAFALGLAAGMVAQTTAYYLRIPGIVVLLLTGVILGPDVLNIIRPASLGIGLPMLVELAVAIILFEGALNLNLERIRQEATTIRRLITIGAVVTAIGGTLAARIFMDWSWNLAMLFGTLVIVTGPTVITPLLRRIRVKRNVHTILQAEGVFIDPIGAIVAVVALEVVIAAGAFGLVGIPSRLVFGAVMGGLGGVITGLTLRHKLVPHEWENAFALAMVLAVFELTNGILGDSGIVATVVLGLVVGNLTERQRALREFKEQLTVLLVSLLFVLLAADVRLDGIVELGWGAVVTVLVLMLIVRPATVAISAAGSDLTIRERAFISWIGPRGIVAAAVASFFAVRLDESGVDGGEELRALVFLVIAITVVLQGLTGGFVASLLGVRRPKDTGYLIVGANPLGRAIAHALSRKGDDVIVIDSNESEIATAEQEGLRAIFGNANDEQVLTSGDVEGRRGFITLTPNEGVNLLLARRAREEFRVTHIYGALYRGKPGVGADQVRQEGVAILFGAPIDINAWNNALEVAEGTLEHWRYNGEAETNLKGADPAMAALVRLPLTILRGGQIQPVMEDLRIRRGDVVTFVALPTEEDEDGERLRSEGWERLEEDRPPTNSGASDVQRNTVRVR